MATTTAGPPIATGAYQRPSSRQRLRWSVSDALTLTRREMLVWLRVPSFIVFTIVQPVMFVLLFRYVFGGAIKVNVKGGYVNFLMPGIIGQSAAFASFGTAIALAREMQKGIIDRYRSMPMARSAVLVGRLVADTIRLAVTVVVLAAVGYAVGFRFENGVGPAIAMLALGVALGVAICCVAGWIGLLVRNEESVGSVGLIWLFPMTFVSSAFVQVQSMPGWLQAFANNQPVTIVMDEMRALALGGPLITHGWESALWLVGIMAVFGTLAVKAYRKP